MKSIRFALLISAFILEIACFGQVQSQWFTSNNFSWSQSSDFSFFHDGAQGPGMEVPKNSGIHAMRFTGLWTSGGNWSNHRVAYANGTCPEGEFCEFLPGPVLTGGTAALNGPVFDYFNRFWVVTNEQLSAHNVYFDCVDNPDCDHVALYPSGYTPPEAFVTWPAQVLPELGVPQNLAPFADRNGDGVYNPSHGDYPLTCGDYTVYSIHNTLGPPLPGNNTPRAMIEIHTMAYTFEADNGALYNTLFVQHKLINKGQDTLHQSYVALQTNFQLGNPNDNYIATDVSRSMVHCFNGSDYDAPTAETGGYENDLGILGVRILGGVFKDPDGEDNDPPAGLTPPYANYTTGWGDGISDNERIGLSGSICHRSPDLPVPPPVWYPVNGIEHYISMRMMWRDGTHLCIGGLGYNPSNCVYPAYHMYYGTSDPLFQSTQGLNPSYPLPEGWTEPGQSFPPGERRMLSSSGPFTFTPGSTQYLDYAIIFARDSHQPGTDVLETLRAYADEIVGMECGQLPQIVTGTRTSKEPIKQVRVYPNPASHQIHVDAPEKASTYIIYDLSGRIVQNGMVEGAYGRIDILLLSPGLYTLVLINGEGSPLGRARFVKAF